MPVNLMPDGTQNGLRGCARCNQDKADLIIRTEHICRFVNSLSKCQLLAQGTLRDCFLKYVSTKVSKRMEVSKIRGGFKGEPNKLLLPLSLGVSSVTLLHVLDRSFQARLDSSGRSGYTLHLLFVDETVELDHGVTNDMLQCLQQRFPSHSFSIIQLSDIFGYHRDALSGAFEPKAEIQGEPVLSHSERLKYLLSSLPSASSRSDMIAILRRRLISAFAQRHDCFGIVYGDSTTRLAERTLSETAKGRGGSLPWLTADGTSPTGMKIIYPMRDLLKKELVLYTELTQPPLTSLVTHANPSTDRPVLSKDTTIDILMTQYFGSVEQNYPSIVANVVRTSSRLVAPSLSTSSRPCNICGLPVEDRSQEWFGNQDAPSNARTTNGEPIHTNSALCYGCIRAVG